MPAAGLPCLHTIVIAGSIASSSDVAHRTIACRRRGRRVSHVVDFGTRCISMGVHARKDRMASRPAISFRFEPFLIRQPAGKDRTFRDFRTPCRFINCWIFQLFTSDAVDRRSGTRISVAVGSRVRPRPPRRYSSKPCRCRRSLHREICAYQVVISSLRPFNVCPRGSGDFVRRRNLRRIRGGSMHSV